MIFIDGQFKDPKECPKSVDGKCVRPECKGEPVEMMYGFAGGYGLGGHNVCMNCGAVYDFSPDQDDWNGVAEDLVPEGKKVIGTLISSKTPPARSPE